MLIPKPTADQPVARSEVHAQIGDPTVADSMGMRRWVGFGVVANNLISLGNGLVSA